jgi:hypothetical protein
MRMLLAASFLWLHSTATTASETEAQLERVCHATAEIRQKTPSQLRQLFSSPAKSDTSEVVPSPYGPGNVTYRTLVWESGSRLQWAVVPDSRLFITELVLRDSRVTIGDLQIGSRRSALEQRLGLGQSVGDRVVYGCDAEELRLRYDSRALLVEAWYVGYLD